MVYMTVPPPPPPPPPPPHNDVSVVCVQYEMFLNEFHNILIFCFCFSEFEVFSHTARALPSDFLASDIHRLTSSWCRKEKQSILGLNLYATDEQILGKPWY